MSEKSKDFVEVRCDCCGGTIMSKKAGCANGAVLSECSVCSMQLCVNCVQEHDKGRHSKCGMPFKSLLS